MLSRLRANAWVRAGVIVLVVGCVGLALHSRWDEAAPALRSVSPWTVAGSVGAVLAGLAGQLLAWRALLADLGSRLPVRVAARAMFLGQLGKYVPGSVWAFVAQVELAHAARVPRTRAVAATALAVVVTLAVNLAVAAATLPVVAPDAALRWWWALALVPLLALVLRPGPVTALIRHSQRLARRGRTVPEHELERLTGRGLGTAVGWSVAAWLPLALHVWLLVHAVGDTGPGALPLAAGAFALAWSLGLLVILAPAGLGVRELVLVVALAPVLSPGAALVVAALSRLVLTLADLGWAALAALAPRTG